MTTADFEELLARQCAPTFIGLKAASLVAFQKDRFDDFDAQLADYEPCFACHGVLMLRLLDEESRALVLFYRADVLDGILRQRDAQTLLRRYVSSVGFAFGDARTASSARTALCRRRQRLSS